jgi:hypothetical protein
MAQEPYSYITKIIDNQTGREICPGNLYEFNLRIVDSGSYEVQTTDSFLHVTYTQTDIVVITLPTSSLSRKNILTIKDAGLNAFMNNITIQTEGSEKIDGEDTAVISSNGTSINLYTDGGNWFIW